MHNMLGGYCKATGLKMGTVMADLMKFYEHVSHVELREEARAVGFNLKLLKALCTSYAGLRGTKIR